MSDSVQLVLFALDADAAAFFAVDPRQTFIVCLQDQAGDSEGFIVFVDGDHHKVGIVDPVTLTGGTFYIGIHADFHGRGADPGHFSLDNDHVAVISTA